MGKHGVSNRIVDAAGLMAHPQNYNDHSPGQIAELRKSLKRFGQVRSIVVQATEDVTRYLIVAGHGVVEAARARGMMRLRADVIPAAWDEVQVLAYLAADNELARAGMPDEAQLAALVEQVRKEADETLAQLAAGSEARLAELRALTAAQDAPDDPGAQVDKAEQLREKWDVKLGQMWRLGDHRVICGDCTDVEVVARVMGGEKAGAVVTDPPYGINREGITNDDPEGLRSLFDGCLTAAPIEDAVVIAFQSPRLFTDWLDATLSIGIKFERLLWMHRKAGKAFPWRGWVLVGDPIQVSSIGSPVWGEPTHHHFDCYIKDRLEDRALDGLHTTIKPLEVVEDLLEHTANLVYEPFLGSGTTLIACERLGRRCRGVEIAPKYVAVTLERWSEMTGETPEMVRD